jgi:hypothetical protein
VIQEHDPMPNGSRSERPEPISFMDASWVFWRVSERDARNDPGKRGDRCLIFSSPDAVRRVWNYPAAWRTLSDEELERLSAQL